MILAFKSSTPYSIKDDHDTSTEDGRETTDTEHNNSWGDNTDHDNSWGDSTEYSTEYSFEGIQLFHVTLDFILSL